MSSHLVTLKQKQKSKQGQQQANKGNIFRRENIDPDLNFGHTTSHKTKKKKIWDKPDLMVNLPGFPVFILDARNSKMVPG